MLTSFNILKVTFKSDFYSLLKKPKKKTFKLINKQMCRRPKDNLSSAI